MGDIRNLATSTSTALASLSNQVTALTDLVTRLLPVRTGGSTEPALQGALPPTPAPPVPPDLGSDPRWEPTLSSPSAYAGGFDLCRGYLGQCELLFCHQPSLNELATLAHRLDDRLRERRLEKAGKVRAITPQLVSRQSRTVVVHLPLTPPFSPAAQT